MADHARHAALDGAPPQLHRRGSLGVFAGKDGGQTIFPRPTGTSQCADEALLPKWARIREIRDVNKAIEDVRTRRHRLACRPRSTSLSRRRPGPAAQRWATTCASSSSPRPSTSWPARARRSGHAQHPPSASAAGTGPDDVGTERPPTWPCGRCDSTCTARAGPARWPDGDQKCRRPRGPG